MFFRKKPLRVEWAFSTNIGGRDLNEDSVLALEDADRFLFVVADGLGGHGMGREAANTVTKVFADEFNNSKGPSFLSAAFDKAQKTVLEEQESKKLTNQMKTTATALYIEGGKFVYGHVGDSRLYHFREGRPPNRTMDHSVSQMLVYSGVIKEEEIASHADRSRLIYVIGDKWDEPKYELSKWARVKNGFGFLLCTDGIWEVLPDPEPPGNKHVNKWLWGIVDEINKESAENSNIDNYSAIAVLVR